MQANFSRARRTQGRIPAQHDGESRRRYEMTGRDSNFGVLAEDL
jgi:hypothetical protein